jgi:outer membrane protein assembly factor BamB
MCAQQTAMVCPSERAGLASGEIFGDTRRTTIDGQQNDWCCPQTISLGAQMVLSTRKSPSCSAAHRIGVIANGNRIAAALLAYFVLVWSANGHSQTVEWSHYFYGKREGSTRPLCGSQNGAANLAKDTAGNVIAASGGALDGAVIQKINAATGAVIWSVNYAGSRNIADCVSAVAADSTGNVVVAGSSFTGVTGFEEKPFVAKLAAETGAIIWIEIDPPQDGLQR